MQKKFLIFISICLVAFSMIACDQHEHAWVYETEKEATCTEAGVLLKTCPCGEKKRETIQPKGHSKQIEKVTKEPTCTEKGEKSSVCSACGQIFSSVEIPALGHKEGEWKQVIAPTCETEGSEQTVCIRCEAAIGTRTIPALGHDWGDVKIQEAATCSKEGKGIKICKRNLEHTEEVVLDKLPHDFINGETIEQKESSCKVPGFTKIKCANCDEVLKKDAPLTAHIWGPLKQKKAPTAFQNGINEKFCTVCGEREEEIVPATHGHRAVKWYEDNEIDPVSNEALGLLNTKSTCSTHGTQWGYCDCWTGGNGNFYETYKEGLKRYKVEGSEKTKPLDPNVHANVTNGELEGQGYFVNSITGSKCYDCGDIENLQITQAPINLMSGRWQYTETSKGDEEIYIYDFDFCLYQNQKSQISVTANGKLEEEVVDLIEDGVLKLGGQIKADRLVSGKWLVNWTKDTQNTKKTVVIDNVSREINTYIKQINFANFLPLTVLSDSQKEEYMEMFFYQEENAQKVYRQELPEDKGAIGIVADGLTTEKSFKTAENGTPIVEVPKGNHVTLKWFSLTIENPTPTWRNGTETKVDSNYTLPVTEGELKISCEGNGEIRNVIIKFV